MRSYIYPLTNDERIEFEATGMIDLSRPGNPWIEFADYDRIFIYDKDQMDIMGPFKVFMSDPKDYFGKRKIDSAQVICSMGSAVYHMDWDPDLVGESSPEIDSYLDDAIDKIRESFFVPSITGDYFVDGLLRGVLLKDRGSFRGHILNFERDSPLIPYCRDRLQKAGIDCEIRYNDVIIRSPIDSAILSSNIEEYSWNFEYLVGLFSQTISRSIAKTFADTPDRYSFRLLIEDIAPFDILIQQMQSMFIGIDYVHRPYISNMCYGLEPLNLFIPVPDEVEEDSLEAIEADGFRFSLALRVLENIFSFNGCRVSQDVMLENLSIITVINGDEQKKMAVVRDIDEGLAGRLEGLDLDCSDIIMILKRFDPFPAPAWIYVSDLDRFIQKSLPIVPRLATNPILGIDPAISEALAEKFDLIWTL